MTEIERRECDNDERLEIERQWIEELGASLNQQVPGRTVKEYTHINRDKIREYQREYNETNREQISQKTKEYREVNKDRYKEQGKQYYQANKDKILERFYQKHDCPCGGKYTIGNKSTHNKTKKHQDHITTKST
jgi:hypothetical protein